MNIRATVCSLLLTVTLFSMNAPAVGGEAAQGWERVVFHVDDSANARWALMLARSYLEDSPGAKIVFVAYGPGVDFLLRDAEDSRGNPYEPAVRGLVDKGIEFRLCAATLAARDISKEKVSDAATIVRSGIAEITRLQLKEGYAYLKP